MFHLDELASLAARHADGIHAQVAEFAVGGRSLAFNSRPAVMGVINLSPDSWYRESVCLSVASAVQRARVLNAQGADIVDIGAESTLAHASRADAALQQLKLMPVLEQLRSDGIPVSIETYDEGVAAACMDAGASVLNFTGSEPTPELLHRIADHKAALILCYVQGANVRSVGDFELSKDPVGKMLKYFDERVQAATNCGVEKLIIDPGLGFYYRNLGDSATRVRHQMHVFLNAFRLRRLGFPICNALPHAFEYFGEEVRCAEPFFAVLASLGRTDLFRTHEVPRVRAVLETLSVY